MYGSTMEKNHKERHSQCLNIFNIFNICLLSVKNSGKVGSERTIYFVTRTRISLIRGLIVLIFIVVFY